MEPAKVSGTPAIIRRHVQGIKPAKVSEGAPNHARCQRSGWRRRNEPEIICHMTASCWDSQARIKSFYELERSKELDGDAAVKISVMPWKEALHKSSETATDTNVIF